MIEHVTARPTWEVRGLGALRIGQAIEERQQPLVRRGATNNVRV
jgi:hypothetical protein